HWERRTLPTSERGAVDFDVLALAARATTIFFGGEGVEEHALPLKTLTDAIRLRTHVIRRFERADADPSLLDDGELTFVIVGGGPTGVEMAGAFVELFHIVLRKDFARLDWGRARLVLVEATDLLLPPFRDRSRR